MKYFKMQLGTNPHVFDVLTIADNGTMSMDCRVCERLVHYDGLTMEHTPYGDRINYGKGSSMPWTDKKGNISAHWSEVPCNDAITDVKAVTNNMKGTPSQNEGTPEDVKGTPAKPGTEAKANVEAAAEPSEQEQPEVCHAVLPQEPQEEAPTPSPLAQMQAELEALRQENARLQAERELQRQLHRSHGIAPENNQHPTDESAQPTTARCKPTDRRWLKPLAVAAASVVACVVIYETGLLIPMGLIGLATSGLVK